ncbi:Predicted arabinose efflux permease, MFS family [Lentzea waywayandensis]|uniref:Predicted arabinose efflux permease, MFS family n=2 Tax=Lentzea waywayandensis TaxID=84724 RepID=A0A1I6FDM2_9PSEU|nr:Predicted arabinose efflux permease, MFS family [Lentzea waywayandensis]
MLSAVGTRMTTFAIGIWLWQKTESATAVTLLAFVAFGSTILFSPIAGALVDRWSRRVTIVAADVGTAVATAILLAVYLFGHVDLWLIYVVNFATGAFLSFQVPAYTATITGMVRKEGWTRANAMIGMLRAAPAIFAPAIAAPLMATVGVEPILAIQVVACLIATAVMFAVALPPLPPRDETTDKPGFLRDTTMAFGYIAARPSLRGLLFITFSISFLSAVGWVLFAPMILARTGNDSNAVGIVQVVGAIGGTVAGIWLATLKPTPHMVRRMLIGVLVLAIPGRMLFGFDSVLIWSIALALGWGAIPFIDGYNQTIWQAKVPRALQGRVFAAQQAAENVALPIAYISAGLLADHLLEPAMRSDGVLAAIFGPITGTGPGTGIAVLYVLSGAAAVLLAVYGFLTPAIRDAEKLLPDQAVEGAAEPQPQDADR